MRNLGCKGTNFFPITQKNTLFLYKNRVILHAKAVFRRMSLLIPKVFRNFAGNYG